VGAESPVDSKLLRWMRDRDDNLPGRFCVAACPQSRLGIGHLQIGIFWKAIGGETFAGNVIVTTGGDVSAAGPKALGEAD
jgi:hypothetical protein